MSPGADRTIFVSRCLHCRVPATFAVATDAGTRYGACDLHLAGAVHAAMVHGNAHGKATVYAIGVAPETISLAREYGL